MRSIWRIHVDSEKWCVSHCDHGLETIQILCGAWFVSLADILHPHGKWWSMKTPLWSVTLQMLLGEVTNASAFKPIHMRTILERIVCYSNSDIHMKFRFSKNVFTNCFNEPVLTHAPQGVWSLGRSIGLHARMWKVNCRWRKRSGMRPRKTV